MWNKIHVPVFPPRKVTTNRGKQVIYITMKMTQMAENKQMVLKLLINTFRNRIIRVMVLELLAVRAVE